MGRDVQIMDGVKDSDWIVVAGQQLVREGVGCQCERGKSSESDQGFSPVPGGDAKPDSGAPAGGYSGNPPHGRAWKDPSVTIRTGIVAAIYPGATSDQVESQVAKKIEDHLFKFAEVRKEKTYSTSRPGVLFCKRRVAGQRKRLG